MEILYGEFSASAVAIASAPGPADRGTPRPLAHVCTDPLSWPSCRCGGAERLARVNARWPRLLARLAGAK